MPDVRVLGVDPGINGGAAIYCPGVTISVPVNGIITLPTAGEGTERTIDIIAFRNWLREYQPTAAFVEKVWAMPPIRDEETGEQRASGATSMFNFGGAYRETRAVIQCCDIPLHLISPARWKKFHGIKGSGDVAKENGRQLVLQRYPWAQPFVKFKNCHNKSDALLIAMYGAKVLNDARDTANEIED